MKYDIFISYSRKDSVLVLPLVSRLKEKGFTVWMDKDGIESGDAFKSVIVHAIKESNVFLFFSSIGANESPWTIKEVNSAVYLKKVIIPVKLDNSDYNDSILFDLVGLDFVDYTVEEKRNDALDNLIKALCDKISSIETSKVTASSAFPRIESLSNKEGFELGYDLTVYVIHKLRGQTSPRDDGRTTQTLMMYGIVPDLLLDNLNAETMILKLNDCAFFLGKLYGKDIENCVCLGALFVLSVIAKRSNISEEFGHSYDEGFVVACRRLGIPEDMIKKLIKGSDDEMEEMLDDLKSMLETTKS